MKEILMVTHASCHYMSGRPGSLVKGAAVVVFEPLQEGDGSMLTYRKALTSMEVNAKRFIDRRFGVTALKPTKVIFTEEGDLTDEQRTVLADENNRLYVSRSGAMFLCLAKARAGRPWRSGDHNYYWWDIRESAGPTLSQEQTDALKAVS